MFTKCTYQSLFVNEALEALECYLVSSFSIIWSSHSRFRSCIWGDFRSILTSECSPVLFGLLSSICNTISVFCSHIYTDKHMAGLKSGIAQALLKNSGDQCDDKLHQEQLMVSTSTGLSLPTTLSVRSLCSFACMMKHLAAGLDHKSEAAGPENHIFWVGNHEH